MRLYVVTEGLFESYLYPKWLNILLPEYNHIKNIKEVVNSDKCYYMFSSKGYSAGYNQMGIPSVYNTIINGLKDIHRYPQFDMLIYLGDSENLPCITPAECITKRKNIIYNYISQNADNELIDLACKKLKIIIQHNCIETWLLGNKKLMSQNIDNELKKLINIYNVKYQDPELMTMKHVPKYMCDDFTTIPQYHKYYLRKLVNNATKGQINTKNIKNAYSYFSDINYLNTLISRYEKDDHIKSFGYFINVITQRL